MKAQLAQQEQQQAMALEAQRAQTEQAKTAQSMALEREKHQFAMAEKLADRDIAVAEKRLASRVGPDGEAQYMPVEDARAADQNATLVQMTQLLAQTLAQQSASNDRIAAALEEISRMNGRLVAHLIARDRGLRLPGACAPTSSAARTARWPAPNHAELAETAMAKGIRKLGIRRD